jgi:DNA-binding response OmpR family regulator
MQVYEIKPVVGLLQKEGLECLALERGLHGWNGSRHPGKSIHFADWELNAPAFELRRGRRTVKLADLPLPVLILIEHGDKVVTREEIAEQIWGKDA